jgi:16S rRNA (uracil1498-N3)-methyltransferase
MRTNRFFTPVFSVRDGVITVPDREMSNQISRVLRLAPGAPIELFDGNGRNIEATFLDVSRDEARFSKVGERVVDDASRVARRVDLYPSAIKGDHLSLVVEKASELGVSLVAPVLALRSVKRDANVERLSRIAREAAEQCGRSTVAEVREVRPIEEAVDAALASGAKVIILDQDAEENFSDAISGAAHVAIFVGPEGGWDDRDRASFGGARVTRAALGGFVLRAETASLVAAALAVR